MKSLERFEKKDTGSHSSQQLQSVPSWFGAITIGTALCLLVWGEIRRPLRRFVAEPKFRRDARNLAIAGVAGLTLQTTETPVTKRLTRLVETRGWGLVKRFHLPLWAEISLAIVLMDYTFYLWHALNHKFAFLWRFHQPHHVDLGLDASTALRFHFGELTVSVGWRAAQILVIGVSPFALSLWQLLMLLEILFHHSNVELPIDVERIVSKFIVTPRLHGIHHSIVRQEQGSNLSSGLTLWDYLHSTLRANIPQAEVTIGVPAYLNRSDTDLPKVLEMPFREQRSTWRLPNGEVPARAPLAGPQHRLVP